MFGTTAVKSQAIDPLRIGFVALDASVWLLSPFVNQTR
jgi:hypothetical protein